MTKQVNIRGDADNVFETHRSTDQPHAFGTRMHVPDGRVFRTAQADSTALVAGRTAQMSRPDVALRDKGLAQQTDPRPNVVQVAVNVINSDQSLPIGRYNEGLLYVVSGGGIGRVYRISTSEAGDNDNNELKVVLDAARLVGRNNSTTRVTLLRNKFKDLAIAESPPSAAVVGVTPAAVAAGRYYWLQTHGAAAVLQQGGLDAGRPIAASARAEGAVKHAVVVVPDYDVGSGHTTRSVAVVNVITPGDGDAERLAPVTGISVVPEVSLGYVLDTGYDGTLCLVHLSVEG